MENAENLADGGQVRVEDGVPDAVTSQKMADLYAQMNLATATPETLRRLIQLSMLKVEQRDAVQANHQMTPDAIGLLVASLIERVAKLRGAGTILDPVVGTGNLLTTVINRLQTDANLKVTAYGVDNDDSLLAVAAVSTTLQKLAVQLYHQDAITALDVPPVDLVVADLPVGYYPLDERTHNYQTRAKEGHSYVHHLLIEQSMNYLKPDGFGFFLVPTSLFQSKETAGLVKWIQSVAHMQGLINLPPELFNRPQDAKSILLLQRQGPTSHQAAKVMLGTFPSLKNREQLVAFLREIDRWVTNDLAS